MRCADLRAEVVTVESRTKDGDADGAFLLPAESRCGINRRGAGDGGLVIALPHGASRWADW